jgi:type IV secretory pathway VirB2 component (pilin)
MPEKESSSNTIPDTARLQKAIGMLTLLIKIGKYLPWIVLAFAGINVILAVLSFTWWHTVIGGILNVIGAIAGFLFFAQLIRRRITRRYNYRYTRKDPYRERDIIEQREISAETRQQERSINGSDSVHTDTST